eukprot:5532148-Prymnesium_polylepis.1
MIALVFAGCIPRPVRLGTPSARVHGGIVFEVAVCNVRAIALSVANSRPCASVVVLSCKKMDLGAHSETDATVAASGPPGRA